MKFLKKYWYWFAGGIAVALGYYFLVYLPDQKKKEEDKKVDPELGTETKPLTPETLPPVPTNQSVEGAANIWQTTEKWENALDRYYALQVLDGKIPITPAEKKAMDEFMQTQTSIASTLQRRAAWIAWQRVGERGKLIFPLIPKTDENADKVRLFFQQKGINIY